MSYEVGDWVEFTAVGGEAAAHGWKIKAQVLTVKERSDEITLYELAQFPNRGKSFHRLIAKEQA